mmetsp:Transcript_59205/g.117312  ORF Transcript_59205/g.117312 Transcript_59205/m.117312 type:complete len:92 (-) Transcript_59205:129-404(-)|eukprot:CAMPEP_0172660018 /NCGR_PEP_ID=MMETSP1074-20121228/3843_1 /TAXON_ID=2916 /ORGANISM="Ceratium fusus, Strain PA161109" /LENGTH=91 /DNA_ID=CAMNT_0013475615 /DNA_START=78 /DNA_END=353 /DNA_ORIENTATION=-
MAFRSQSFFLPLALAALFATSVTFVSVGHMAPMVTAVVPTAGQAALEAAPTLTDSSVVLAGGEEALFYIFILLATLITLVLSVVLREAPRV